MEKVSVSAADFENARKLQSRHFVFDAHSDIPLMDIYPRRLRGERRVMSRIHAPRHREGVVNGAIGTVQCDCMRLATEYSGALRQTLEVIDMTYAEENECKDDFAVAKSGTELEEAARAGKFSFLLGLEGAKAIEGST